VVDGVRTPFAKSGGPFKDINAQELGRLAVVELLARTEYDPARIDEVIFGNCGTPADAANIGRIIALNAGIPQAIPGFTVHRNCASGIESIAQAYYKIASGVTSAVIVGGTESMSRYPLIFSRGMTEVFAGLNMSKTIGGKLKALSKFRLKDLTPKIALIEGLTDPVCGLNMGQTAELLAREFNISRQAQDEFALLSHQRAVAATNEGRLAEEIVPVYVPPRYGETLTEDFGPRPEQSLEALGKLRPIFDRRHGTVTPGNSCMVTDGACALLVMEEERARREGYQPLGRIRSFSFAGLDPARMGLGPTYATPPALEMAGAAFTDIDLIEINEAFAAQVLANEVAFASARFAEEHLGRSAPIGGIDRSRLNVNGGAIALGHPVGVSGSRIALTALKELRRRDGQLALATLCVGGGQGAAMVLEAA
jgi:acetyl-CoA C-acetyltransferase/acetyl-CoA acyltransferase